MSRMTKEMKEKIEKLITLFVEGRLSAEKLIEGIVASSQPVTEKTSNLYDVRHGQNREIFRVRQPGRRAA